MITRIKTTRQINLNWSTEVLVNEGDSDLSYGMSIPALPHEDGTSLGWVMIYGRPLSREMHSAVSIMDSYRYLLSADITAEEAVNRLRCLRREYQSQPAPKEAVE